MNEREEKWIEDGGCSQCENTGLMEAGHMGFEEETLGCTDCYGVGPFAEEVISLRKHVASLKSTINKYIDTANETDPSCKTCIPLYKAVGRGYEVDKSFL